MKLTVHEAIDTIPAAAWNHLAGDDSPFLRHEFLAALEHHGCVGETFGWLPRHLAVHDAAGRLVGAAPLYIKDNSYGEFVFDWAWADAYERAGLRYYPKAVVAAPYTPATGPRLLVDPDAPRKAVTDALIEGALGVCRDAELSSLHWLFTSDRDTADLVEHGLLRRVGCQFHWHNAGYRDFADFLDRFSAAKRKKVNRERRRVQEAGIEIRVVHGDEADAADLTTAHGFYQSTFDKKWGVATLNLPFFQEIARTMGEQLLLVLAYDAGRPVAGAINLRGARSLYGRHWGCSADYHSLHFEACYYQGIDYCIRHGLTRFEPGAQGEHKISRGFLPTPTWSAHWIGDARFRAAIGDFLVRETAGMAHYMDELASHSPYKDGAPDPEPTP